MKNTSISVSIIALLLVPLALSGAGQSHVADSTFSISLPKGISVDVPSNWTVLSGNQRLELREFLKSKLAGSDSLASKSDLPFAANLIDDQGRTLAVVNIRYYPELPLTQADARAASTREAAVLDSVLEGQVTNAAQQIGSKITEWSGTEKRVINGVIVFVTEYRRRALKVPGTFRVRLVRTFAGERSNVLTASYWESYKPSLQPMLDSLISSLEMTGVAARDSADGSHAQPVPFDISSLLIALVLTWGIGLAPPLLIRFVLLNRRMRKWPAVGTVGVFWFGNVILFAALGSESNSHTSLILVAVVSYFILRKKSQPTTARG